MRYLYIALLLLCLMPQGLRAQNTRQISGTVSNSSGEMLAGATVIDKATGKGSIVADNGNYTISVPNGTVTLIFSYFGMKDKEIVVDGKQTKLNVVLEDGENMLEEIVIQAGYGLAQKRADMTGSAFQVNSDKIATLSAARIDNLLGGIVPGVSIDQSSGEVRTRYRTRVRGDASLSASSEPLWIIDGTPVYTGDRTNQVTGTSYTVSPLSFINPDDIESMTVLKDAATTALYGADGGNGVILVTTKSGSKGKTRLRASVKYGIAKTDRSTAAKVLNAAQWWPLAQEAWTNAGHPLEAFPYRDNDYNSYSTTDTDWFDVYYGLGNTLQVNVSASGGNDRMNNYVSGSYYNEKGTAMGNSQERISLRAKSKYQVHKKVSLEVNLSGSYNRNKLFTVPTGLYGWDTMLPIFSPYDEDGVTPRLYNYYSKESSVYKPALYKFTTNEVPNRQDSDNNQASLSADASALLNWDIFKGLSFTSQVGASYISTYEDIYYARTTLDGYSGGEPKGVSRRSGVFTLNCNNINRLNFNREFGSHRLGAMLAIEFVDKRHQSLYATGHGFINDAIKEITYSESDSRLGSSTASINRSLSYLGQFSYSFKNRYYLSLTYRKQGYSSFSKYTRWGNFSSVGLSWNVHNEKWFNSSVISLLKFKASYGNSGNSRVDSSSAYGTYSYTDSSYYGGIVGATQASAANPGLTWENTYITNLGVAVDFWDRISLEFEVYRKYTKNLLYSGRVSSIVSESSVMRNVGEIRNDGFELSLTTRNIVSKDFEWTTDINASHNDNKIMKLYKGTSTGFFTEIWTEGASKNSWYLVEWAGVDPSTGAPMWYDQNGNITFAFSYNNRKVLDQYTKTPFLEGGINNRFRYRNFSLSILATYAVGGWDYNTNTYVTDGYDILNSNTVVEAINHWQKPGDLSINPRVAYQTSTHASSGSTRNLYKSDHIYIKNLALSYDLPRRICEKLNLQGLTGTFIIDHVYLFTPDQSSTHNSYKTAMYSVPRTRTWSLELSINF